MAVLAAGRWGDFIEWLEGHEASALVLAAFLAFLATVILVVVTAFYANSAGRQAEANAKMVEEMREQRLSSDQPTVILRLASEHLAIGPVRSNEKGGLRLPPIIDVQVYNAGRGPAVDLVATMVCTG